MAMVFEQGTASSQHDLLDKIRAFLVARGWTVNKWADAASNDCLSVNTVLSGGLNGKRLHVSKDSTFWNFRSAQGQTFDSQYNTITSGSCPTAYAAGFRYYAELHGIFGYPSTGYSAAADSRMQPGGVYAVKNMPSFGAITAMSGPIASYRFFYEDSSKFFMICVELQPGVFSHLLFCNLDKVGTYTGGEFYAGSAGTIFPGFYPVVSEPNESGYHFNFLTGDIYSGLGAYEYYAGVRIVGEDGLAATYDWRLMETSMTGIGLGTIRPPFWEYYPKYTNAGSISTDPTAVQHYGVDRNTEMGMLLCSPSSFSSITPMVRVPICVRASNTDLPVRLVGYIPNIRFLRGDFIAQGEVITVGNEQWMVLPRFKRWTRHIAIAIRYEG